MDEPFDNDDTYSQRYFLSNEVKNRAKIEWLAPQEKTMKNKNSATGMWE